MVAPHSGSAGTPRADAASGSSGCRCACGSPEKRAADAPAEAPAGRAQHAWRRRLQVGSHLPAASLSSHGTADTGTPSMLRQLSLPAVQGASSAAEGPPPHALPHCWQLRPAASALPAAQPAASVPPAHAPVVQQMAHMLHGHL